MTSEKKIRTLFLAIRWIGRSLRKSSMQYILQRILGDLPNERPIRGVRFVIKEQEILLTAQFCLLVAEREETQQWTMEWRVMFVLLCALAYASAHPVEQEDGEWSLTSSKLRTLEETKKNQKIINDYQRLYILLKFNSFGTTSDLRWRLRVFNALEQWSFICCNAVRRVWISSPASS